MQIDYIKTEDINDSLPFKTFFKDEERKNGIHLSILEDKKLIKEFFNARKGFIGLIKLDEELKKYITYKEVLLGYYIVNFGYKSTGAMYEWLYDEKNDVLISKDTFIMIEDQIMMLQNIKSMYLESSKEVEVDKSIVPMFNYSTAYLTLEEIYNLTRNAGIPTIINSNSRDEALAFLERCGIEISSGLILRDENVISVENLYGNVDNENKPPLFIGFNKLEFYNQVKVLNFLIKYPRIAIVAADASKLDDYVLNQLAVITPKQDKSLWYDWYCDFKNIKATPTLKDNYFGYHAKAAKASILAFYAYIKAHKPRLANEFSSYKLLEAERLLRRTENPRSLLGLLGEEVCEEFTNFITCLKGDISNTRKRWYREVLYKGMQGYDYFTRQSITDPELRGLYDMIVSIYGQDIDSLDEDKNPPSLRKLIKE